MRKFLESCTAVLSNERADFEALREELNRGDSFIAFQPMISLTPSPALYLEHSDTIRKLSVRKHLIYIIPIGASGFFFREALTKLVSDFYFEDLLPEFKASEYHCLNEEDVSFEQMLLLSSPGFPLTVDVGKMQGINCIYVSFSLHGRELHCFLCGGTPEQIWDYFTIGLGVGFDVIVEANKGFGDHFCSLKLFERMQDFENKALLPYLILQGQYTSVLDGENFILLYKEYAFRTENRLYITPWAQGITRAKLEAIKFEKEEEENAYSRTSERLNAFDSSFDSSLLTIEELVKLKNHLLERMKLDDSAWDFSNIWQMSFYSGIGGEKTEAFFTRVKYFSVLCVLRDMYEQTGREKDKATAAYSEIVQMITYHEQRYLMDNNRYYCFTGARKDFGLFVAAVYDSIKFLCRYRPFQALICSGGAHDILENTLLSEAYARKDTEFAHFVLYNGFYGELQTELFCIAYQNDENAAADLASKLNARCIARIFKETNATNRRRPNSEVFQFVYEHISRSQFDSAKKYLPKTEEINHTDLP